MPKRNSITELIRGERAAQGPAWRLRLAQRLPEGLRSPLDADRLVSAARRYRACRARGGEPGDEAVRRYPDIEQAHALEDQTQVAFRLQIMLLGCLPEPEMLQRAGLDAATYATWRGLFFDVDEHRTARDWLEAHVYGRLEASGRGDDALLLRMAAAGGAEVARALLDADAPPKNELERVQKERQRLQRLAQRALSLAPTNGREALRFLKLYLDHQQVELRLTLAEERLAERCRENARNHEIKLGRQRLAELRLRQRTSSHQGTRHSADDATAAGSAPNAGCPSAPPTQHPVSASEAA